MRVNEIFRSVQGEGVSTGQPAIFVRTSGCSLNCDGCDTDHSTFIEFDVKDIVAQCADKDLVIITGGEPTLQDDFDELVQALYSKGHVIDIETNGTIQISDQSLSLIRYVVCSPKRNSRCILESKYKNLWYKFVIGSNSWTWTFDGVEAFLSKKPAYLRAQTYLMPFGIDLMNAQSVWDQCCERNLRYSDRLQWRIGRK